MYTDDQYKKLKRKIDRYLLPLIWLCYGIQQTDKTVLGLQAIFGLRQDTGLVGQQYSWLTTILYVLSRAARQLPVLMDLVTSAILSANFRPILSSNDGPWAAACPSTW